MDSSLKILVKGPRIAVLVVEIENIFRFLPDMYIMKAFIATWEPGFIAMDMALALRFATSASIFRDDVTLGVALFRSAATRLA